MRLIIEKIKIIITYIFLLNSMTTILVLATVLAVAAAIPTDTYNPEYDNFNVKEIVENDRLLKNYAKCFLDEGPCTPEGVDFKSNLFSTALIICRI